MSTTSREFFERMYRTTQDPWSFASNDYEQYRYQTILGFVPPRRFSTAFEPGCSVGELTVRLAARCGHVTAIDIAEAAVETARQRCAGLDNVDVHQGSLLDDLPDTQFDLVVFSEIGYYFTKSQLAGLASSIAERVADGGRLLAVHWTGVSADHLLGGNDVHRILREHLPMQHNHQESHSSVEHDGFVLDVYTKLDPAVDDAT
ncbi:MAG: class I SAM-dependent methyltransferase [Ilumatobacteraceae bacterium]